MLIHVLFADLWAISRIENNVADPSGVHVCCYSLAWYSSTAGNLTPPILSFEMSVSTPSSTSGNGPIGVMAFGLMS